MTVSADFLANVTRGSAPLTIPFTDLSTGSPTNWFWNFGDGFTSIEQNPSHIYNAEGEFTVSLKVWDETSTSTINQTSGSPQIKQGSSTDFETAFSNFLADSYSPGTINNFTAYRVAKAAPGGSPFIFTSEIRDVNFDLSAQGAGSILVLNATYNNTIDNPSSRFVLNDLTTLPNPSGNILTPMADVSSHFGENPFTINPVDVNSSNFQILSPAPGNDKKTGWVVTLYRIIKHNFNSQDILTVTDLITVTPNTGFDVSGPRTRFESHNHIFDDKVANNPTVWKWERRPSGIGAAYVEFSTDKNPTETFDIENPTP